MRPLPTRRRLVAPAAALVLLTACGGSGSPSAEAPSSTPALSPVAAVQSAAQATSTAGSSRIELVSETSAGGQQIRFDLTGVVDNTARTGLLSFALPEAAGGGVLEQRLLGDVLYMSLPQEPGVFYEFSQAELVGTSFGTSSDPAGGLKALEAVGADVREVGKERVRDADTTRYAGSYDLAAATEKVGGVLKGQLEQFTKLTGQTTFPFEAWLDDQQRVRKFVQTLDIPASEQTGGKPVTTTTTLELFDFGVPVEVSAPPADKVKDGAPFLDALTGAGGPA